MRLYTQRIAPVGVLALALVAPCVFPGSRAGALDWRLIQDDLGAQTDQVYLQSKALFEEDFEGGILGEYPGHPGVRLVKDPDGNGRCAQFSTSPYQLKDLVPVQPGHWLLVGWKARNVSGGGDAHIEIIYQDAEGKTVEPIGPVRRKASSGKPGADWNQEIWSLEAGWAGGSAQTSVVPRDARRIGLRFFHEAADTTVTLIDDIRVVNIQPVALKVIADAIAEHQRLLTMAVETIRALPDSPKTRLWKQVVAARSDRIASQLKRLARQDPTSEDFIHGSDAPLLFARRLADAAEALKRGLVHPAALLTYRTRPFPVLGRFTNTQRRDPVGVLPFASQIEGELAKGVTIQACRGEYEPVSIAVWSPENMDQVAVEASDLKGPAGLIPASSLDIKVIKWWYQRNHQRPLDWRVLVPRFLLNDDSLIKVDLHTQRNYLKLAFPNGTRYVGPSVYSKSFVGSGHPEAELEDFPLRDSDSLRPFDLVSGQNKQLWVTVKVPEDAAAGQYAGDLLFKAGGREIARFEVRLRVLPFSLPAPKTRYDLSQDYTFSFYYRGWMKTEGKGKVGDATKSEEQFRAELRMMYEHGIVAPLMLLHGHYPGSVKPEARFRKHLEIMRETGMSGRPLYLGENVFRTTEKGLAQLRQELPRVISIVREYGFTDVYFYGQDEPSKELLQQHIPVCQTVHEVGGKVQVSVTYSELDYVPNELDLLIAVPPVSRARAAARHRLGHKVHSYGYPMSSSVDALQWRRNYGLHAWSQDYDGVSPYCFMHNSEDTWNELEDRDLNIAFPTVNGAISTLALEGFREGADDVRYATLLMKRIEETRKNGMPEAKAVAEEAFQWVGRVDFKTADPDFVRARMVDFISTLTQE